MFLYSIYSNEGTVSSQTGDIRFDELKEGKNPKVSLIPNQTVNQWAKPKADMLVNQCWERLRNLY
jgi:hypothetical protein